MKLTPLLILILLVIACAPEAAVAPTLAPTLAPLAVVDEATQAAPTEVSAAVEATQAAYPLETPTEDGAYPAPATPVPTIDPYPVEEVAEPTAVPVQEAVATGLIYFDEAGVWRVAADGSAQLFANVQGLNGVPPVLSPDGARLAYVLGGEPMVNILDPAMNEVIGLASGTEDFVTQVLAWEGDTLAVGAQSEGEFGPGIGRLSLLSIADGTYTTVSANPIGGADFHPLGTRLAYSDVEGIKIYDLIGETTTITPSTITDAAGVPIQPQRLDFSAVSWSPSQQLIGLGAFYSLDGETFQLATAILDLADNSVQLLHPFDPPPMGYSQAPVTWHPSEPLLAFEVVDADPAQRGVWLLNYATGEEQLVMQDAFAPIFSPDGAHLAMNHEAGVQVYTLADGSFTMLPQGRLVDWR